MELYQDTLRQLHRRQRDYSRRHHDTWMDAMCPWVQAATGLVADAQLPDADRAA